MLDQESFISVILGTDKVDVENNGMENPDDEIIDKERFLRVLKAWDTRAHRAAHAHYYTAETLFYRNRQITIVKAMLSIAVLFCANVWWLVEIKYSDIGTSVAAVLLVITTMLQFLLRDSERAMEHKVAASSFSNLSRKIERYSCRSKTSMGALHAISRRYSEITTTSPTVKKKQWEAVPEKADSVFDIHA